MSNDSEGSLEEEKLDERFQFCEQVIAEVEKGSSSPDIKERLRKCVEKLQELDRQVDKMALFSTNDQIEDLPTSSLQYLLVPVYLAFGIESTDAGIEKRMLYVKAAQVRYREYLERLLIYDIIRFKLPWVKTEEEEETEKNQPSSSTSMSKRKEDPSMRRTRKVERLKQEKALEENLEKLKAARKRDEDERTIREILIVQMRLWAIRAMKQLEMIDDEIEILEHMETMRHSGPQRPQKMAPQPHKPLNTFIIARSQEQKKVYGLGYPSIPTYTVDEWFDQMNKTGHFSGLNKPITITGQDEAEKSDSDEDDSEEARQKKIHWDEFKDDNPRGWGNTYNKG